MNLKKFKRAKILLFLETQLKCNILKDQFSFGKDSLTTILEQI